MQSPQIPRAIAGEAPSYQGLKPASRKATLAARGSSRKTGTRCERLLRSALWRAGCRYRKNVAGLPGKPDLVFPKARVVVFCDGDFWHGRSWPSRKAKLSEGNNPKYWIQKIERNLKRDQGNTAALEREGWTVLRFWETDILANPSAAADRVRRALGERLHG